MKGRIKSILLGLIASTSTIAYTILTKDGTPLVFMILISMVFMFGDLSEIK